MKNLLKENKRKENKRNKNIEKLCCCFEGDYHHKWCRHEKLKAKKLTERK